MTDAERSDSLYGALALLSLAMFIVYVDSDHELAVAFEVLIIGLSALWLLSAAFFLARAIYSVWSSK